MSELSRLNDLSLLILSKMNGFHVIDCAVTNLLVRKAAPVIRYDYGLETNPNRCPIVRQVAQHIDFAEKLNGFDDTTFVY